MIPFGKGLLVIVRRYPTIDAVDQGRAEAVDDIAAGIVCAKPYGGRHPENAIPAPKYCVGGQLIAETQARRKHQLVEIVAGPAGPLRRTHESKRTFKRQTRRLRQGTLQVRQERADPVESFGKRSFLVIA